MEPTGGTQGPVRFEIIRRRPLVVVVLALLAVPLAVTVVGAAIPDASGQINGCYRPDSGYIRIIDVATDTCLPGEESLAWKATGTITGADIVDGSITTDDVADNSLTNADIADESLTADELATNSVGGQEIANGSINQLDLHLVDFPFIVDLPSIGASQCTGGVVVPGVGIDALTEAWVHAPVIDPGLVVVAQYRANDQVSWIACNTTGNAIDDPATTWELHYFPLVL